MASTSSQLREFLRNSGSGLTVKRRAKYFIEIHRRIVFPITILLYPLVVFPAAIGLRKRGKAAAFTGRLFLFLLSFFFFTLGSNLAYEGWIPGPVGAWFPVYFLLVAAIIIFLPYCIRQTGRVS